MLQVPEVGELPGQEEEGQVRAAEVTALARQLPTGGALGTAPGWWSVLAGASLGLLT